MKNTWDIYLSSLNTKFWLGQNFESILGMAIWVQPNGPCQYFWALARLGPRKRVKSGFVWKRAGRSLWPVFVFFSSNKIINFLNFLLLFRWASPFLARRPSWPSLKRAGLNFLAHFWIRTGPFFPHDGPFCHPNLYTQKIWNE